MRSDPYGMTTFECRSLHIVWRFERHSSSLRHDEFCASFNDIYTTYGVYTSYILCLPNAFIHVCVSAIAAAKPKRLLGGRKINETKIYKVPDAQSTRKDKVDNRPEVDLYIGYHMLNFVCKVKKGHESHLHVRSYDILKYYFQIQNMRC